MSAEARQYMGVMVDTEGRNVIDRLVTAVGVESRSELLRRLCIEEAERRNVVCPATAFKTFLDRRGRSRRKMSPLTRAAIIARLAAHQKTSKIAKDLGVPMSTISNIKHGGQRLAAKRPPVPAWLGQKKKRPA